jgi:hypothetical protein
MSKTPRAASTYRGARRNEWRTKKGDWAAYRLGGHEVRYAPPRGDSGGYVPHQGERERARRLEQGCGQR